MTIITSLSIGPAERVRARRRRLSLALGLGVLVAAGAGCTHVKIEPSGTSVRRLGAQEAPSCERLGTTHVKVLSKVLFVGRSETKMAEELTTLARNSAGDMGGNAVIAEGGIHDGKQTFGVYRCPED